MAAISISQAVNMVHVMLRDRAPSAEVTSTSGSAGAEVKAVWRRPGVPEAKLLVRFEDEPPTMRTIVLVGTCGAYTPSAAIATSRLYAETGGLACEVETMFGEGGHTLVS